MSCLEIILVFTTLFTLRFVGNLVALMPRFHAYVVSVYKTDKGSHRDHITYLTAAQVTLIML